MAIPRITRANVLAAIDEIQRDGVPPTRLSTRYLVAHDGGHYPPKYVVSLAVKYATGRVLYPGEFSGGRETNGLLSELGFTVVEGAAETRAARQPRGRQPVVKGTQPSVRKTSQVGREDEEARPLIARVVVKGKPGSPNQGEKMLLDLLRKKWPGGLHVKFLITPGGFVKAPFPAPWTGNVSWESTPRDFGALLPIAGKALGGVLTTPVLEAAAGKIDVLTIGVDLVSNEARHQFEHAELVAVCDVASGRVHWTGKSFPTSYQERDLVQVVDLESHLMKLADERVLVLGCHDLNMFSARAHSHHAPGGERNTRCDRMRELARRFKPTVVLQHPHQTITPHTWGTAWSGLRKDLPDLKGWASGIGYFEEYGEKAKPLKSVLKSTRSPSTTIDIEMRL